MHQVKSDDQVIHAPIQAPLNVDYLRQHRAKYFRLVAPAESSMGMAWNHVCAEMAEAWRDMSLRDPSTVVNVPDQARVHADTAAADAAKRCKS